MNYSDMVYKFHLAMELPTRLLDSPKIIPERCPLRAELIREESEETVKALERGDLVEAVDGWCDTIYVAEGAGVEFGLMPDAGPEYALAPGAPALRNAQLLAYVLKQRAQRTVQRVLHKVIEPDALEATPYGPLSIDYEGNLRHELSMLVRVCRWSAAQCGVDLDPFFAEVHRSNMSKVGGPIRADGKRLKPLGWSPPRIREMLEEMGWST